ncbi:MAG: hypothetical protein K2X47_10890 [Bdellovibrionales bacterium]|nr:hypothetical protein [Bdellovibrionales bacterium]
MPDGTTAIIIYPASKTFSSARFQPKEFNIVVYYEAPHQPDIAEAVNGDPNMFVVREAFTPTQ